MHEQCLMLRPRMQTSSPLEGRDGGMPCTTFCRVQPTPRDESCLSPCLCPSCILTQEGEMEMALMTARARPPQHRERLSRGTANLLHTATGGQTGWIPVATVMKLFVQSGLVAGE